MSFIRFSDIVILSETSSAGCWSQTTNYKLAAVLPVRQAVQCSALWAGRGGTSSATLLSSVWRCKPSLLWDRRLNGAFHRIKLIFL